MSQSREDSHAFDLRPLWGTYLVCSMSMMAFVALIGPIARVLHLAAWQAGAVVTVGGVLWMALARTWGAASDRYGRRPVLMAGVGGFTLSYLAMCAVAVLSLRLLPASGLAFAGLLATRGLVGAFYAAIPSVGQALVADHVSAPGRPGAMASLGAASAAGLVLGPALASALATFGLGLPLTVTAVLPLLAFGLVFAKLPRAGVRQDVPPMRIRLDDARLRRPMVVAFVAMFCVTVAQITVGFFAIDRLGLAPADAGRVAGLALTMVGVALILSQLLVRRLRWGTHRLIATGAAISAVGFGAVALASTSWMLVASFFVAAAGMGWVFPAFSALAANSVGEHEQGSAAGSIGAAQGLGSVLGPLAGTLLHEWAPSAPYVVICLVLVAVACWPGARSAVPRSSGRPSGSTDGSH